MKLRLFLLVLFLVNLACVSSAMVVPTPTSTKTPPPPTPKVSKTATLDLNKFVVSSDVLEVRDAPGEKSLNVGYLEKGEVVTVYETQKTTLEKCLTWARVGVGRWVCADRLTKVKK